MNEIARLLASPSINPVKEHFHLHGGAIRAGEFQVLLFDAPLYIGQKLRTLETDDYVLSNLLCTRIAGRVVTCEVESYRLK